MQNIGFIGMGNMAQALAVGFINSKKIDAERIFAFAPDQEKLIANSKKIGFKPVSSVKELCASSDTLFMACKPYQIESVLSEIKELLEGKTIVSVAAGWDFEKYRPFLEGVNVRLQFVMPNTPAMVGCGLFLFEKTNSLFEQERSELISLFECLGMVTELPSNLMGIGGAVTGCGPAFVDLMIEAYADAAVKYGVPRSDAYKMTAKMVEGSAKLCLESKKHPGELKDAVCSPAGTTIRGVCKLEEKGFRSACISSIDEIMNFKRN